MELYIEIWISYYGMIKFYFFLPPKDNYCIMSEHKKNVHTDFGQAEIDKFLVKLNFYAFAFTLTLFFYIHFVIENRKKCHRALRLQVSLKFLPKTSFVSYVEMKEQFQDA